MMDKVYMETKKFMMSMKYNRSKPEEFGLVPAAKGGLYIDPSDNSLWQFRLLYDFGWGQEIGYYRLPMPDFETLVEIILHSVNETDKYGAAAVILEDYPDQLLEKCMEIMATAISAQPYLEFFKILQLDKSFNRSSITGKDRSRIAEDYSRWMSVAKWIFDHYDINWQVKDI